jgi:ABC-type branched-subunit amino acid transport system permease subunit
MTSSAHVTGNEGIANNLPLAHSGRHSRLPIYLLFLAVFTYLTLVLLATTQAVVLALIVAGAGAVWLCQRFRWSSKIGQSFGDHETLATTLSVVGVLALAVLFHDNSFVLLLLSTILLNMTACFGLNIQFGYVGMLNFAGAAMFGIGAYTAALVGQIDQVPGVALLPLGGVAAALIGLVLLPPMLRTKGHYSAVITVAFALLFTSFLDSFAAVGGSQGLSVRTMTLFGWSFGDSIQIGPFQFSFYMNFLLLALALAVVVGLLARRIERSWIGLRLDAVRIDETASSCFGIDIVTAKIFAFTAGNFVLGMIGAGYALMLGYIAPSNFTFGDSLILITVILLGGIGSIWGIVVTTAIVQILPERLQAIQEYRLLIYAVLVLVVLRFMPHGLLPRSVRVYFTRRSL